MEEVEGNHHHDAMVNRFKEDKIHWYVEETRLGEDNEMDDNVSPSIKLFDG